jgi:SAM-dependent methyltransferase
MKAVLGGVVQRVPGRYLEAFGGPALKILALAFHGNAVECPVCGGTFRRFLPYGHHQLRQNALCPSCLSLERHRLLWLYLQERTNFFTDQLRVLHIAPERCFVKRFEAFHRLRYVTADLKSPLAKIRIDVQDIPFEDDFFDAVLCNHVLEHVEDDRLAIQEISRVLKPDGWAILQSPFDPLRERTYEDHAIVTPAARAAAFGQHEHVRIYGRDYGQRLAKSGLQVTEDDFVRELPDEEVARYSLPPDEVVFLCRKAFVRSTTAL